MKVLVGGCTGHGQLLILQAKLLDQTMLLAVSHGILDVGPEIAG